MQVPETPLQIFIYASSTVSEDNPVAIGSR